MKGDCASSNVSASLGDHSVTFDTLAEGRHNNCTLTVTDAAGNVSAPLVVNAFDLDVTAPAITGVALSQLRPQGRRDGARPPSPSTSP